jgi:hypothetical protein
MGRSGKNPRFQTLRRAGTNPGPSLSQYRPRTPATEALRIVTNRDKSMGLDRLPHSSATHRRHTAQARRPPAQNRNCHSLLNLSQNSMPKSSSYSAQRSSAQAAQGSNTQATAQSDTQAVHKTTQDSAHDSTRGSAQERTQESRQDRIQDSIDRDISGCCAHSARNCVGNAGVKAEPNRITHHASCA